jgi:TrpR-related protein YerC/YecD
MPRDLLEVIASLDNPADLHRLFSDLLTPAEIESVKERWAIVKCLAAGESQRTVRDRLGVSVTTVSRGNRQLKYGHGGFMLAFESLQRLGRTDPRGNRG